MTLLTSSIYCAALLWLGLVLSLAAAPRLASAEEENALPEATAIEAPPAEGENDVVLPPTRVPALGLDSLLRPRSVRGAVVPKRAALRGGQDRESWARDFADARTEEHALEKQVGDLQRQIRETSQGDWNYTPTGGAAPTDPEVLRLRAQLKRDKRSLEAATTRLRDLEVEASLANVPDDWIEATP